MKKLILATLILVFNMTCKSQENHDKFISKNGMAATWYYENNRVYFEMSAPTTGWVAIGFNTTAGIQGAYLLMGKVENGKPDVIEHYTLSPGNYKTISSLGKTVQVSDISGEENAGKTTLRFSVPIKAASKYQRDLTYGRVYTMILAFSREDDFQHHSSMRTSLNVKL